MILKKSLAVLLSLCMLYGALPVNAQLFDFSNPQQTWQLTKEQQQSAAALNKKQAEQHKKELDNRAAINVSARGLYSGLGYFDRLYIWQKRNPAKAKKNDLSGFGKDAYIAPAWEEYFYSIRNPLNTPYAKNTPYEIKQAMEKKGKTITKLLKNNPRYQKELKKAQVRGYTGSAIEGIVIGLLTVATVYTFGATAGAEGALITAWFGGGAAASAASASMTKALTAIVLAEIFIGLGDEITINLYDDLTARLIKYKYLDNNAHAQELIANIKSAVESYDIITNTGNNKKITQSSRWVDEVAQKESIIRLYGLNVIEAELSYSADATKYDMAMLDIINLFSYRTEVSFEENVFDKTYYEYGEEKHKRNQSSVDVGTGRLLERTPELTKALKAIQKMENTTRITLPHPRGWQTSNGATVIMPHM